MVARASLSENAFILPSFPQSILSDYATLDFELFSFSGLSGLWCSWLLMRNKAWESPFLAFGCFAFSFENFETLSASFFEFILFG